MKEARLKYNYRGIECTLLLEKGSIEEGEQRAVIKTVKRLSKRKNLPYIHIVGAGVTAYDNLQEVLWVGTDDKLETITIFDGSEERTLSLWRAGDYRIREIRTIPQEDIEDKTSKLDTRYKKLKREARAMLDFIEQCDFNGKYFCEKSRREKLSMLKRMYANVFGSDGPAGKIKAFAKKYG
jgi:hypothetical protein